MDTDENKSADEPRDDDQDDGADGEHFSSDDERVPLAWDANGERFEVPDDADCWRVKKATRRGPGEVLYNPSTGLPLRIGLDATVDELSAAVFGAVDQISGRYRLELLDTRGKVCKGIPLAVVEIKEERGPVGLRGGGCAHCAGASGDVGGAVQVLSHNLNTAVQGVTTVAAQLAGAQSGVVAAASQAGITRRRYPADPVVVEMPAPEPPPAAAAPIAPPKPGWMQFLEALPQLAPVLPQIIDLLKAIAPQAPGPSANGVHQASPAGGA